jgi:hypothetical protein
MSFDRPGLPHPGHELPPEIDETLAEEGLEFEDHEPDIPDHPGSRSAGPQPNPPRRPIHEAPAHEAPVPEEPVHEAPAPEAPAADAAGS